MMFRTESLPARIAKTASEIRQRLAAPVAPEVKRIGFAISLTEATLAAAKAGILDAEAAERALRLGQTRGSLLEARQALAGAQGLVLAMTDTLGIQRADQAKALRAVGAEIVPQLPLGDAIRQTLEAISVAEAALDPVIEGVAFARRHNVPISSSVSLPTDFTLKLLRQIRRQLDAALQQVTA